MTIRPCEEPFQIEAEEGHVIIEGKGGVVITMTPDAALASADLLADGAAMATGQRLRNDMPLR